MISIPGYDGFAVIGRGGFATVYRARQQSVGREVAIKVLNDPAPDADLVRRFERESKAVGALSWHPHIAAVVDAGTTPTGRAFIVFELLTGGSLEDHLGAGPLPWSDAVSVMVQVSDAVEAAHRAEMLHRDIKPANILLNRLGDAKLADFGIASMQDGNKTETGMLATTVSHAAPELFDGAVASPAADIYALGSTLHTLITGRPPFAAADGQPIATIIKAIATQPPPALDRETAPPELANVIAHSLAKQPMYRPRSALAFGKALQQIQRLQGLAVTPMPVADNEQSGADATIVAAPPSEHANRSPGWQTPAPPPPTAPQPRAEPAATSARTSADVADARTLAEPRKAFGRTIAALVVLVVLTAVALGGAIAWQMLGNDVIATTAGGAEIVSVKATVDTAIEGFPPEAAIDRRDDTSWGIAPNITAERNIAGTTFTIRLAEPVLVRQVGITNGSATRLGRISHLLWGVTTDDFRTTDAFTVEQRLPTDAGDHLVDFGIVTDQIALVIADVHDVTAADAGIAEILLVVDGSTNP